MTTIPTPTQARSAVSRREVEFGGVPTRFLVDQIRSCDVRFISGNPSSFFDHDELEEVEVAVTR